MIIFGSFLPSLLVGLHLQSLLGHGSRHCYGIITLIGHNQGHAFTLWAQPQAITKSTKNQNPIRGVPSRNHRPRLLNLINAYTTTANHEAARTALARIAKSLLAGFTAHGVTKARIARPNEMTNSGLKAFGAMGDYLSPMPALGPSCVRGD